MKRILIIHTGGTFGMVPMEPDKTLAPIHVQKHIFNYLPELKEIAEIDFEVAFNLDSSNIQIEHWQQLADLIYSRYHDYDGFLVIHGTDAMVFTASALSFMLKGLKKPVILTGSQRPLSQIRSDARSNLINSLEMATGPIPEVAIFFGVKLFRGNRTIKISSTHYDAFESPNYPELGEVGLDIKLYEQLFHFHNDSLALHSDFDRRIFSFRFFPGLSTDYLDTLLTSPLKAVVIDALGAGNLAIHKNSLIPWISRMTEAGKMVVIGSQSPYGRVNLDLYECGKLVKDAGGISAGDMTSAATLVKLMFLLGRYPDNIENAKTAFVKSIAGELTTDEREV